jgi:hypothetical protein
MKPMVVTVCSLKSWRTIQLLLTRWMPLLKALRQRRGPSCRLNRCDCVKNNNSETSDECFKNKFQFLFVIWVYHMYGMCGTKVCVLGTFMYVCVCTYVCGMCAKIYSVGSVSVYIHVPVSVSPSLSYIMRNVDRGSCSGSAEWQCRVAVQCITSAPTPPPSIKATLYTGTCHNTIDPLFNVEEINLSPLLYTPESPLAPSDAIKKLSLYLSDHTFFTALPTKGIADEYTK